MYIKGWVPPQTFISTCANPLWQIIESIIRFDVIGWGWYTLNVSVKVVIPSSIVIIYDPWHKLAKLLLVEVKPLGPIQAYVYVESPPFAVIFNVPIRQQYL